MTEIKTTGIYEYALKFDSSWGRGDFTIVCSESTKGTLDALILSVISTDLEAMAGQIAGIMGTTSGISNLKAATDAMTSQFSVLETALGKMSKDLVSQVKEASGSVSAFESVFSQLSNLAAQIKEMAGESSVNLSKLYDVSKDKKDDMVYLKNKTQELKAAMELTSQLVQRANDKPVTQTWYEYK
jgi:methyl-accepting chemotaxis protein